MYLNHFPDYIDSKYNWIQGSTSIVHMILLITIFVIFSFTLGKEEVWLGEILPMLLPGSSCVYMPSLRSASQRVFLVKVPFLAFFPLPW